MRWGSATGADRGDQMAGPVRSEIPSEHRERATPFLQMMIDANPRSQTARV